MPLNLSREDRHLLVVLGGLFGLTVLVGLVFSPAGNSDAKLATTYSAASEGTKAAYLLLHESGYHAERWEQPPASLPNANGTVLLINDPSNAPSTDDRQAVQRFVDNGGTLILSGPLGSLFIPQHAPTPDPIGFAGWQTFPALTPSAAARQAPSIRLMTNAFWIRSSPGIAWYGDDTRKVVIQVPMGEGQVFWIASSSLVSNAGIREPGNMEFLLAAVGDRTHRILWDEYFHGHRQAATSEIAHPQMQWLLAQLTILGVAVLVTYSRRSGPQRMPTPESRLSPLEFVQALGNLYARAHAANVAVDIYYERFRYWLTKRLGVRADASPEELARAVHERHHMSAPEFLATLKACESGRFYPDLSRKEALDLIQKLYRYAAELRLFPLTIQETK